MIETHAGDDERAGASRRQGNRFAIFVAAFTLHLFYIIGAYDLVRSRSSPEIDTCAAIVILKLFGSSLVDCDNAARFMGIRPILLSSTAKCRASNASLVDNNVDNGERHALKLDLLAIDIASVVKIDLNTPFESGTFQVELMPGTQLTDRREHGDMQPNTLRSKMLLNGTATTTIEDSDEPSHEPKSP